MQEFDSIDNITPNEHWDIALQIKLNKARRTNSNAVTKLTALVLVLSVINIGMIWNTAHMENTKSVDVKQYTFKIISEELLIPNN
jgi:hypothetical protein